MLYFYCSKRKVEISLVFFFGNVVNLLLGASLPLQPTDTWVESLGGIFGPALACALMYKFGRKVALASVYVPQLVSSTIAASSDSLWGSYVSRVATGMSFYAGMALVAIYVAEACDGTYRGSLYATGPIFVNFGSFLHHVFIVCMSARAFNLTVLGVALGGAVGVLLFLPEPSARAPSSAKAVKKSAIVCTVLVCLQQLSGHVLFSTLIKQFINQSGWVVNYPLPMIDLVQLTSSVLAAFGYDLLGRTKMLVFSSSSLAFTIGILATFYSFAPEDDDYQSIVPLVCLLLFFVFYNCGVKAIPFLYLGEILPEKSKALAVALIMAGYGLIGFTLRFFYDDLIGSVGLSGMCYLSAASMALLTLYVMTDLVETRGKSLEDIQRRLGKTKRSVDAFASTTNQ